MKKEQGPKLPKGVAQEFVDIISTASTDELKALVVILQVQNHENEAFKETPEFIGVQEEFDHAKERYQLVAGPVKDVTVAIKNKTKLVLERLKEKGGA